MWMFGVLRFRGYLRVFGICLQLESLPSMVAGVWSDNSSLQLEATTQFRKLLSIGTFMCITLCNLFLSFCSYFDIKV